MSIEYYDEYNEDVSLLNLLSWKSEFYESMTKNSSGEECLEWSVLHDEYWEKYKQKHSDMIQKYGYKSSYERIEYSNKEES